MEDEIHTAIYCLTSTHDCAHTNTQKCTPVSLEICLQRCKTINLMDAVIKKQ